METAWFFAKYARDEADGTVECVSDDAGDEESTRSLGCLKYGAGVCVGCMSATRLPKFS